MVAGRGYPPPAIHYSSHAALLQPAGVNGRKRPDAIVVSASRAVANLRPALELGRAIEVPVVVMCSRAARADAAADLAAESRCTTCVALDLSTEPRHRLPDFATSRFRQAQVGSHGDLSSKRNLGLELGRRAGWRRLLFLDDDISDLNAARVLRATAGLDAFAAVGMPAKRYPDNSVVGHAHRLTGGRQGVFVSGSALAVDLRRVRSFFPDIYNEDWLFLAPHLDRRQVAYHGSVRQASYEPFRYPYRAGAQEFGDVLAEGLVGYLHTRPLRPLPSIGYWSAFLDGRAAFLARTKLRCRRAMRHHSDAEKAVTALESAQQALAKVSAGIIVEYLDAWRHDLATWRQVLTPFTRSGGIHSALRYLGLPYVTMTRPARNHALSAT